MRKLQYFIVIAFILFLPTLVAATPALSVNQTSFTVESETFNKQINFFTVTNIGNETLYNLTINPVQDLFFNVIPILNIGETKTINFSALSTTAFDRTTQTKLKFSYLTSIPPPAQTFDVSSTDSAFTPNSVTIKVNDSVRWTNNGANTHNLQASDSSFNTNISPSGSFIHVFSQAGQISVFDWLQLKNSTITINPLSSISSVNDPNLDIPLSIRHISTLVATTLDIELSKILFTIEHNNSEETSLIIKNIGSGEAKNINLSSSISWLVFDENNFDLAANNNNALTYKIKPQLSNAAETNKTYNITIFVNANNVAQKSKNIEIFIPYSNISSTPQNQNRTLTQEEFDQTLAAFLAEIIRLRGLVNESTNVTDIIADVNITTEVASQIFVGMARDIRALVESGQREGVLTQEKLDAVTQLLNSALTNLTELEKSSEQTAGAVDRQATSRIIFWWVIVLIILAGIIIYLIYMIKKTENNLKTNDW